MSLMKVVITDGSSQRVSLMRVIIDGSSHYWIQVLCRVPEALGKGQIALGKAFAECGTRQRTHGKKLIGKDLFAECLLSGTRQRLCRVPRGHSAKKSYRHGAGPVDGHFAECQPCRHSAKIFYFF